MDEHYIIWTLITLASMPFAFGGFTTCLILKQLKKPIRPWLILLTALGVSGFVIPIHVSMNIGDNIEADAREEVLTFLSQSNLTVRLFSSEVDDPRLYIDELRKLKPMPAHHSHASGHVEVVIEGKQGQV